MTPIYKIKQQLKNQLKPTHINQISKANSSKTTAMKNFKNQRKGKHILRNRIILENTFVEAKKTNKIIAAIRKGKKPFKNL